MQKVVVEESFWEVFPEAQILTLFVEGIDNQVKSEEVAYFTELLKQAEKAAKKFVTEEPFSQNPVIAEWREAFSKFKTKKGARSSIEALLKRVNQGKTFTPINPLVDIYNSVSLTYGVPCGGEDVAKIVGALHLGKAQGGEAFLPLGSEKDAPALPEEIIYYDDEGAICRCFNWREAQRTMLTEATTEAILVIEALNPEQIEGGKVAMDELQRKIDEYFGVTSKQVILKKDTPKNVG